ncbi:restriction endonuclease [Peribacillus frigoritolerans]|uniref:nSTAND1 domain-containing NTPase n=1 Tax=Peribacillus frigoritolerans TaxID=450367 RepID=UPI0035D0484B
MPNTLEVIVSEKSSTTVKGRLLEKLGSEVLNILQYDVVEEIRITGMEVDLLAKHRMTREEILVECKAHSNTLSADVLTKLLGNVFVKGVSSGWLFTSGPLGKDAKGLYEEWKKKSDDERRKLSIYNAEDLIKVLISSGKLHNPNKIKLENDRTYSEEQSLLITEYGRFWAFKVMHVSAGVPYAVLLYDAETGCLIRDTNTIASVMQLQSTIFGLEVLNKKYDVVISSKSSLQEIDKEILNISTVSGGDQWADYRPSRPKDFVGREELLKDTFSFIDSVIDGATNTRLIAIKSPSGWGKSSYLLKLVSKSKSKFLKNKYYIHAVDVRTAISERYSEFALLSAFKAAVKDGFLENPSEDFMISSTINPLNGEAFKQTLKQLNEKEKVLILFFDQFEEIFSKTELSELFNRIREMALAIDSAKENILLGFAWKTDGTTPTEHPAYFMWQSLSDRRKEFSLSIFSNKEMQKALSIFSKEIGEKINPNLKKYLIDHCQGYPWLLKKLCIHVFSMIKQGIDQSEIIGNGLDIEKLFEKDLSELSTSELACIRKIASESPIDVFKIDQDFGAETMHSLINKRLIIRKGHKLIVYWDIFKDYVLNGAVPKISMTYMPQANFNRYKDVLELLIANPKIKIQEIAASLSIGIKATDNIVRDMVVIGNASRFNDEVKFLQENDSEAISKLLSFFKNHIIYKSLIDMYGEEFSIDTLIFDKVIDEFYKETDLSPKTISSYKAKILNWFINLRIVNSEGSLLKNNLVGQSKSISVSQLLNSQGKIRVNARVHPFLASAPAERVNELIGFIRNGQNKETLLVSKGLRNAITVAKSLGLIYKHGDNLVLNNIVDDYKTDIAIRVKETETILLIESYKKEYGVLPDAKTVGDIVSKLLNKVWKDNSKTRTGLALLKWLRWADNQIKKDVKQLELLK